MHNVPIQISLGHLPLRTEEPCAGSTRQRCLQDHKMSGDHKVTVGFYGLARQAECCYLTIGVWVKQVKGMIPIDGMMLCRCVRALVPSMVVHECTSCSGDWDLSIVLDWMFQNCIIICCFLSTFQSIHESEGLYGVQVESQHCAT